MSGNQATLPLAGSIFKFAQHGKSGASVSELLPYTAKIADELCFVKSLHTEAINHDPAITFFQTGHQLAGRPSMGAWLSYGLGSANENLPAFVVLISQGPHRSAALRAAVGQRLSAEHAPGRAVPQRRATRCCTWRIPTASPATSRRKMLDRLAELHALQFRGRRRSGDRRARRAVRDGVPHADERAGGDGRLKRAGSDVFELYGEDAKHARHVRGQLPARPPARRARRAVHPALSPRLGPARRPARAASAGSAQDVDRACYALVTDLKQRGLLDDTLVVWGGEFGRTNYSQGKLTATDYGRDHHPRCFTVWMAGGGIKPGITYGATDDFGYNVAKDPVHVHDLQATILHLLGIDHEKLTYQFQGRYYRLTDVHGNVVKAILA